MPWKSLDLADGLLNVHWGEWPDYLGEAPHWSLFTLQVMEGGSHPATPIPAATYAAWCMDEVTPIDPPPGGTEYRAKVFVTLDESVDWATVLPAHPDVVHTVATWRRVNYLLNRRFDLCNGAEPVMWEIQRMVYSLLGQTPTEGEGYPPYRPSVESCLLADIDANAATWEPSEGDVVAVVFNVEANWEGNPATDEQLLILEVPFEALWTDEEPEEEPASEVIFRGEVVSVSVKGRVITARAASGGLAFDRQLPRFRMGPTCNHIVFSFGCGLQRADWTFTADVAGPVSSAFPFVLRLENLARTTGPAPGFFAGWFAGGFVELGGERRAILDSTVPTAGALDLHLDAWWRVPVDVGAAVALYPGCDGRWETCGAYNGTTNPEGKFDNRLNFGGHPFVPSGNPSLVKVSRSVAGGKK